MISKLIESKTTVPTMLFFRNVMGLLILLPMIIKGWPKIFIIKNKKTVLLRSIMGLSNLCFIFLAVREISLVNTTLLNNSAPFFVPFIVWIWFRTPIDHKIWPAIIVGFFGIALILQPDKRIFNLGSMYALISGIALALTIVTARITTRSEKLPNFLVAFFTIGAIISLPFALWDWRIDDWITLVALLSLGLLSFLGQILLMRGLRFGKANQLAPFTYSTVVFSGIYEWLLWGHVPGLIAYIGMGLIIAAGIWIVIVAPPPEQP